MILLLTANAIAAIASVAFAVVGGVRPAALSESATPSVASRKWTMIAGATLLAVVHVATAVVSR